MLYDIPWGLLHERSRGANNLDPKTGIPKLGPILTRENVTAAIVPYGYASYAGICAMAEMSPDNLILAADAKRAKRISFEVALIP